MKRRLGNLERQLLAYAQLRKVHELRTGDLARPLGITAKQERPLFRQFRRATRPERAQAGPRDLAAEDPTLDQVPGRPLSVRLAPAG